MLPVTDGTLVPIRRVGLLANPIMPKVLLSHGDDDPLDTPLRRQDVVDACLVDFVVVRLRKYA